ncbi:CoA-binding protein [Clostridium tertium]|uniref:CoA-binding domain-containing protein n=1 Tax=Clostridium tertium TaxID=1559 RepID=A0A6N3BBN6_9CLOT
MDIRDMIKLNNWAVIGDVSNQSKFAYKIIEKFKEKGYTVAGVHPRGGENIYKSLKDIPFRVEAIDLCINSKLGIKYLEEANELGIKNVLIQPGAESEEILKYCMDNKINAIENCALVQLRSK